MRCPRKKDTQTDAIWPECSISYDLVPLKRPLSLISDPPSILSVGPSKVVSAQMMQKAVLTCEAEGKPSPKYQWLQKLPTQEVLIRGYEKTLVIDNITYDHQGEFVCKAVNVIRGEERPVQSDPIRVEVSGAPQVMRYTNQHEVSVQKGEDASLEVLFCGDPLPLQSWYLGDINGGNSGNHVILASGTGHNRFVAESARKADREDCYYSTLRINGAHPADTHAYQLRLSNGHGNDTHTVHLVVRGERERENEWRGREGRMEGRDLVYGLNVARDWPPPTFL